MLVAYFLLEYMMHFYGGWCSKGRTTFKWNPTSFSSTVSFQKPDKSQMRKQGKRVYSVALWKPPSISHCSREVTPRHPNSFSPHRKLTGKCFLFVFLKLIHLRLTWGGFLQTIYFQNDIWTNYQWPKRKGTPGSLWKALCEASYFWSCQKCWGKIIAGFAAAAD